MKEERQEISTQDLKPNREKGVNVLPFIPGLLGISLSKVLKSGIHLIIHPSDK